MMCNAICVLVRDGGAVEYGLLIRVVSRLACRVIS
jgi:hypothetical protein